MTMLASSLPSWGPAVLIFPSWCPLGLLVQRCQVPALVFPVWAAGPAPRGYPAIVAQCLDLRLPGQPIALGLFQVPRWGLGAQRGGEGWQRHQIPSMAEPSMAFKTPDAWAMASLGRWEGQALNPELVLWVTLACPLPSWAPSQRP